MGTDTARPLGALHVASVVIGAIIGVGIFFTPASLARALPSPGWVLAIWMLGGVISISGALVYAELGGRSPRAGGVYVFLREGLGPRVGPPTAFLYGWLHLLVIQPGSMAIIAIILVDHIAYLTGPLDPRLRSGAAVFAIAAFTGANLVGLRAGGRVQVLMASLKLCALASLIAIGVVWGDWARLTSPKSTPTEGGLGSWVVLGLIPVLFTFGGAYHGTFIAGSVKDPERAVPRGITAGISAVLIGYLGVNVAYLALLGHDGLAASKSPAAEAAARALGANAGSVLAGVIVVSAAGILNTVCLGFPFVIYAMARDGSFFPRAGELHPRTGRPTFAVAAQGALACAAVLVGSAQVDVLLTGIAFADASFQAAVAVVHLRSRRTAPPPGVLRAPFAAGATFLVLSAVMAVGSLIAKPLESAVGAGAMVAGLLAWVVWRRR